MSVSSGLVFPRTTRSILAAGAAWPDGGKSLVKSVAAACVQRPDMGDCGSGRHPVFV